MKIEVENSCSNCGIIFKKVHAKHYLNDPRYKPLCNKCIKEKIGKGVIKSFKEKIKLTPYEKLTNIRRKKIIWQEQGQKCLECGFNFYSLEIGPYQLHHKDRNSNNKSRENECILCYNCHFMTGNWGFTGRKHKKESLELIITKLKLRKKT